MPGNRNIMFLIIGALGFVWLAAWLMLMRYVDLFWAIEPNFSTTFNLTWLDLVVGTSVVVGLIGREMWRRDHKILRALVGPAVARAAGSVSPSRKPGTWFGAMSGDAE